MVLAVQTIWFQMMQPAFNVNSEGDVLGLSTVAFDGSIVQENL